MRYQFRKKADTVPHGNQMVYYPIYDAIEVVKENDDYWIFEKPAGLLVESSPYFPSLEDYAFQKISKLKKKPFVGVVHRLDRPVSGLLLMAKKKSILKILNEQFREGIVQKSYLALVENEPKEPQGILKNWISKDQKNKRAQIHTRSSSVATACSLEFKFLGKRPKGYLLEIHPKTGKYHQIRAQLAFYGCPIVGDLKYGATSLLAQDQICLHAKVIEFKDPVNNAPHHFESNGPSWSQ